MSKAQELKPCPFCGAGETVIHVNQGTWTGRGYGEPVSVEVRHWCTEEKGQPSRSIIRVGRDESSAIAAWNRRYFAGSEQQAAQQDELTKAARDMLVERARQVSVEGWTPESDDRYVDGALSDAGAAYALMAYDPDGQKTQQPEFWPWEDSWWKPGNHRRNLEKAGALILAEMERLDRAAARASNGGKA